MYKAEVFAEYFASFIGNGVFPNPSTGLQVSQGDGMRINVRAGRAWINGYYFNNDSDYVFTLNGSDGVLHRIDRIIVRWSLLDREITLAVKRGSLSVAPIAPPIQRDGDIYELALADVAINAGVVTITQANITDLRLSNLCGIVHGTVEQVDTTTIFNQFQSWFETFTTEETAAFNEWFENIRDILDENIAAYLLSLIEDKQDKITAVGLLKRDSAGNIVPAVPGVDYLQSMTGVARICYDTINYYMNAVSGNDNNDGLTAATAWRTIDRLNLAINEYDIYLRQVWLRFAAGTYTGVLTIRSKSGDIRIEGSSSIRDNIIIPSISVLYNSGNVGANYITAGQINVNMTQYIDVFGCAVTSALTITGSNGRVESSVIRNTTNGINVRASSVVHSISNTGTGNGSDLTSYAAIIIKNGTQPSGTTAETKTLGGQIFS